MFNSNLYIIWYLVLLDTSFSTRATHGIFVDVIFFVMAMNNECYPIIYMMKI